MQIWWSRVDRDGGVATTGLRSFERNAMEVDMMQAWKGWTATAGVLPWAERCARQQGALRDQQRRRQDAPFSEREVTGLSFVR
jgi:hypothetical protein